ncbi:MAG: YggS family pyridoxal phosphate-dependent enzyme [Thermodesulfovibrionales bacterium]|nr:YggS family pyridoxal phosphate-dependent enzyme [Thermodesulfovibrionales bacterium]
MISKTLSSLYKKIYRGAAKSDRNPDEIILIAVSKGFPIEAIREAADCGIRNFGENRIQEAISKIEHFQRFENVDGFNNVKWHFIGHLQSNKAKQAVKFFDYIHSVDSVDLIVTIDKEAFKIDKVQSLLLQVKLSDEVTKYGISVHNLNELVETALSLKNISLQGLMTIPPFFANPEQSRPYFKRLREIRDEIERQYQISLPHLSMGMSNDFEIAIEEGSTMIRVGTAIFGER